MTKKIKLDSLPERLTFEEIALIMSKRYGKAKGFVEWFNIRETLTIIKKLNKKSEYNTML